MHAITNPLRKLPAFVAAAVAAVSQLEARAPLNIVLLYADDLGYGDLRSYNPGSKIPTPHLDRLAADGLRFTDAHSSSGICTPSRYALLTGRSHWRDFHGIDNGFDPPFFKPGQLTLQQMLRELGYTTHCIGKWHLGWDWDSIRKPGASPRTRDHGDFDWTKPFRGGPVDHGFDTYFGDNVINFPPYAWIENDRVLSPPGVNFDTPRQRPKEGDWETRKGPGTDGWDFYQVLPTLADRAVADIHAFGRRGKPFFLFASLPSPHTPIVPAGAFDNTSEAGAYGDFVVQTDHVCGRILDALRATGRYDNTLVIFSADNGAEAYAYPRDEKHTHWSSHPLRGVKRDLYEGGHRVPTIVKWPGVTAPGTTTGALFSQTDLFATLASHLGYELPRNAAEDSFDFLPYLTGRSADPPRTTMVHNTFKDQYAIRHHEWVLVDHPSGTDRQPPQAWMERHEYPPYGGLDVGLYHLGKDLAQRHNLAAKHPEKVGELRLLLDRIRNGRHTSPRLAE